MEALSAAVYRGKTHLVKAEVATIYPDNPVAVWDKLASELKVLTAPAYHHGILATHFELAGFDVRRMLEPALNFPAMAALLGILDVKW